MPEGTSLAHYPQDLQTDLQRRLGLARDKPSIWAAWDEAIYWPFEQSRLGKSDLLREWLQASGLSCGTFSDIRVHDGSDPLLVEEEARVLLYSALPCRDWPNITRGLVKRGHGDEQIRGILGENALRVFEQVCG